MRFAKCCNPLPGDSIIGFVTRGFGVSVHKYDCLDYFHVDPHFGGDEAFEELCKELHKNDIKIIFIDN